MPAAPLPTATPPAPHSMLPGTVVVMLATLLGIQPITTDLYLPALPLLTESLGAQMVQAQLTLTALLLAFGTSQLLWGPLSDRFGRRPVLLLGLAGYTVASIGSTLAASMDTLIVWRTLQGAAMGAAVMGARAVIRDLYKPIDGARVMSKALSGLGVIACLSAPLGGLLAHFFDWRMVLVAPAVFGAASVALIVWKFQETLPRRNPLALHPATLARTWFGILRNPTFVAWSSLTAASYGGLFTFLAASSFVFIRVLDVDKTRYGLLMFSLSVFYLTGTVLCRGLLRRYGVRRSVAIACWLSLGSSTVMGVIAHAGWASGTARIWTIMVPMYVFMLGHGIHQACGQSGAVGPFPQAAGAASALNGFVTMLVAFAIGQWLGTHMDGTVFPLINGIWFWGVVIALSGWTLVQKHGEPGRVAEPNAA